MGFFRQELPLKPQVADCTIARMLDGALYTSKLVRDVPPQRNSQHVLDARFEYATWLLQEGVARPRIYVDECGFNIWTRRSMGRSPSGKRCYRSEIKDILAAA